MKQFILSFFFFLNLLANASAETSFLPHSNCQLNTLYDSSFFEESLSVDEYPELSIEVDENAEVELTLGSSLFSTESGDFFRVSPIGLMFLTPSYGGEEFVFIIMQQSDSQSLLQLGGRRTGESTTDWTPIGLFVCN
jgi:hypothetical protein